MVVFWVVACYSILAMCKRFGGTHSLHLQGRSVRTATNLITAQILVEQYEL
jgi:hypothetical protein